MSYLDTIGACECNDAERADRARGYLGWYHDLAEVLAHYPQPREGWSFNNIETRSVWIYDGVRWCNTTQGNPFTMITHPNVSGTVRDGYPSTFYYVPNTTGLTRFNFGKPNGLTQGSVSINVEIKSISDIVFIEWTGSELHASVHILDVDVVRHKEGMLYDVNGKKIELAELVKERHEREENDGKLRGIIGFIHRPVFLNAGLDVEFVDELFSPTQPAIERVTVGLLSEDRNSRDITIGHRLSNIGDVSLTIDKDTYRQVHKIEYADGTVGYIVLNENVFDDELFPTNKTYIVEATRLVSPADNPSSYAQYQSDSIVNATFFDIILNVVSPKDSEDSYLCVDVHGGNVKNGKDYRLRLMRRRKRKSKAGWAAIDKHCRKYDANGKFTHDWVNPIDGYVEFGLCDIGDIHNVVTRYNGPGSVIYARDIARCFMSKQGDAIRLMSGYKKHQTIERRDKRVDILNLGLALYRYENNRAVERVSNIAPLGITLYGSYAGNVNSIGAYWNVGENGSRINPRGLIKFPKIE